MINFFYLHQDFLLFLLSKENVMFDPLPLSYSKNLAEPKQNDLTGDVQYPIKVKTINCLFGTYSSRRKWLWKHLYLNLTDDFVSELTNIWCEILYLGRDIRESIVVSKDQVDIQDSTWIWNNGRVIESCPAGSAGASFKYTHYTHIWEGPA